MSHRGTKALREAEWRAAQYKLGREHGFADHQGMYADQYYMRGWRAGQAARDRLIVVRDSKWGGNGFGTRTIHRAVIGGNVVGEWASDMAVPWLGDQRGAAVVTYADWLAAVKRLAPIIEARHNQ